MVLRDSEGSSPRCYTIKDMNGGKEQDRDYPCYVSLAEGFLKMKMKAMLSDFDRRQEKEGKITDIGCPLCRRAGREGSLKLKSVEPVYRSFKEKDVHIGNRYEYVCSSPDCQGRFAGGCLFVPR